MTKKIITTAAFAAAAVLSLGVLAGNPTETYAAPPEQGNEETIEITALKAVTMMNAEEVDGELQFQFPEDFDADSLEYTTVDKDGNVIEGLSVILEASEAIEAVEGEFNGEAETITFSIVATPAAEITEE